MINIYLFQIYQITLDSLKIIMKLHTYSLMKEYLFKNGIIIYL